MFKNATASKSGAQVLYNGLVLACFKRILCHKKIAYYTMIFPKNLWFSKLWKLAFAKQPKSNLKKLWELVHVK